MMLSHYHSIILPRHTITPSHHHTTTPSRHHTIALSHYHTITPSHHQTITCDGDKIRVGDGVATGVGNLPSTAEKKNLTEGAIVKQKIEKKTWTGKQRNEIQYYKRKQEGKEKRYKTNGWRGSKGEGRKVI